MAATGQEAVDQARQHCPDVIVMDISMPVMSGIEATKHISKICKHTKVAILSMHHTTEYIQRALEAGAVGYLLKDSAGAELVAAIRAVNDGKRYISKSVAKNFGNNDLLWKGNPIN
jgi:two-component system nitrate/nitrite response regulator NarL